MDLLALYQRGNWSNLLRQGDIMMLTARPSLSASAQNASIIAVRRVRFYGDLEPRREQTQHMHRRCQDHEWHGHGLLDHDFKHALARHTVARRGTVLVIDCLQAMGHPSQPRTNAVDSSARHGASGLLVSDGIGVSP